MNQSPLKQTSPAGDPQSTTQFKQSPTEQLLTTAQSEFSKLVAELLAKLWHEEQAALVQSRKS